MADYRRRPRNFNRTLPERFWEKVDKSGDCWVWTAGRSQWGYGVIDVNGTKFNAHRVSFELTNGPIPPGLHVRHSCDNPACVNPAHLSLGTHADNMRDRDERGRTSRHGRGRKYGELNPSAKLTSAQVAEIRGLWGAMTQKATAKQFGVSPTLISKIQRGALWNISSNNGEPDLGSPDPTDIENYHGR